MSKLKIPGLASVKVELVERDKTWKVFRWDQLYGTIALAHQDCIPLIESYFMSNDYGRALLDSFKVWGLDATLKMAKGKVEPIVDYKADHRAVVNRFNPVYDELAQGTVAEDWIPKDPADQNQMVRPFNAAGVQSGRTSCKEPNTSQPPRGQRVPGPGLYDNPPSKYSRNVKEEADQVTAMWISNEAFREAWRKARIGGEKKMVRLFNRLPHGLNIRNVIDLPPGQPVDIDLATIEQHTFWSLASWIDDRDIEASWPPEEPAPMVVDAPKCECGVAASGGSSDPGPGHSRWCPIYRSDV